MSDGSLHEISVEIGKLTEGIGSLRREIADIKGSVAHLETEVKSLTALRNRGAGLLIGVGMISSTVSALITWFLKTP